MLAWGEDKCGELGKTRGERRALSGLGWDYLWSCLIHTLTEERRGTLHAQTSGAEIREGERDRGLGQTRAEVCCSCECSVFIKQVSSDLRVFYITCLHFCTGTAGTGSHVLIRNQQQGSKELDRLSHLRICGAAPFSFLSCSGLYEYIQIRPN